MQSRHSRRISTHKLKILQKLTMSKLKRSKTSSGYILITRRHGNQTCGMPLCTSRLWRSTKAGSYEIPLPWLCWLFNAELPPGQKLKLAKLKGLTEQDKDLTEEQEQEFLDKLAEHREHKTTSSCTSNAAAACNMLCTSDAINREVSNCTAGNILITRILLEFSSTTLLCGLGPTVVCFLLVGMSTIRWRLTGMVATTLWTFGRMWCSWIPMRFANCLNSGHAPDIRVSLISSNFVCGWILHTQMWQSVISLPTSAGSAQGPSRLDFVSC